ncbi:MAG: HNH endonuclease [Gammaproteobacteria bacterium]|nr:HNH endonuclease [Gammaproteobacteria bacterium]
MSLADEIREHALQHYVVPARTAGNNTFAIRAGEVSRNMSLHNRVPAVCDALSSRKFLDMGGLELIEQNGPRQSTTTTFRYSFVSVSKDQGVLNYKASMLQDVLVHPELHTRKEAPLGYEVFNFMRSHLQTEGFIPIKNKVIFDKLDQKYTRQQIRGRAEKFRRKFRKACEEKGYDHTLFFENKNELVEKLNSSVFAYDELEKKTRDARKVINKTSSSLPISAGVIQPQKRKQTITQYARSPLVRAWVLERAGDTCELCSHKAPFVKEDGTPFLEIHHITQLSQGGPDTLENTVALCPNCHRDLHYGRDRKKKERKLRGYLKKLNLPG